MKLAEIKGKKILIVGFGLEGSSVQSYLKEQGIARDFGIADDLLNPFGFENQQDYDLAIRSPSIGINRIKIPYTTVTNLFFSNTRCITIAVTGTKGKSTTSSLIHTILKENGFRTHLGGNIGNPLTNVLQKEKDGDYCVCELSSYQLEDILSSAHISVFLNFFPEHMDHHGSINEYWKAKSRIVSFVKPDDFFVYNSKYKNISQLAKQTRCQIIPFSYNLPFDRSGIPLLGNHNYENICASYTVAQILGIPNDIIERAVKSFRPLSHRLEKLGTYRNITFYDDAISTTPESTICAIESIPCIDTIFLGGLDRGYNFTKLLRIINKIKIKNVILFPTSGEKINLLLKKFKYKGKIFQTRSMKDAVTFAYANTHIGHVALLSCASPSYSLWKNFEEKGKEFQLEVINQGKKL